MLFKYVTPNGIKWVIFKDYYKEVPNSDWRNMYKIIPLGDCSNKCNICDRYYQKMIIKLPELADVFEKENHVYIDICCPICHSYKYSKNFLKI